jgi:cytochrome c biogenesis protein ResB
MAPPPSPERVERFDFKPTIIQNSLVRLFGGLKFGLTVLVLIIIASSVGEMLPASDPNNNLAFKYVFKTWWFRGLLVLLVINLILNTYLTYVEDTYPQFLPILRRKPDAYKALKIKRRAAFRNTSAPDSETLMKSMADSFRARGYRTYFSPTGFYAHRGLIARFGSTITHLGLITILVGALAESFLKKEGYVDLVEGETVTHYRLPDDPMNEPPKHELGFSITCLDFDFLEYPGTRTALKYKTTLTLDRDTDAPVSDFVRVNHKVHYGGWTLHQNSYAPVPYPRYYVGLLERLPDGGRRTINFESYLNERAPEINPIPGHENLFFSVEPDGTGRNVIWTVASKDGIVARGVKSLFGELRIGLISFFPDFAFDETRGPYNASDEPRNPAALIEITTDNTVVFRDWVFYNLENRPPSPAAERGIDLVMTNYRLDPTALASASMVANVPGGKGATATVAFRSPETGRPAGEQYELTIGASLPLHSEENRALEIAGPFELDIFRKTQAYLTTLSITQTPGVPIVWLGAVLASFGPILAFFVSRRRVWAHVDWDKQELWVGGESRYSRESLEDEIAETLEAWSKSDPARLDPPLKGPSEGPREVLSRYL